MAEIELRGISKSFGGSRPAVAGLDLTIAPRERMVVVGPSGSGKSTLLRMIAGLETPDSGLVRIAGRDMTGIPPHRRDIAMVFQNPALYPYLSVFDNLAFGIRARGLDRNQVRARVNTVAGLLGLDGMLERRPSELSGGERQRVAIGRAIARRPPVLLCDEPFSNLDPPLRAALREEVAELHRQSNSTLVLVTHDQSEALLLGDRVAVLDRGRLLQVGTPREVYDHPASITVAIFIGSPPINIISCEVVREGDRTRLHPIAAERGIGWGVAEGIGPRPWPSSGRVEIGLRPESIAIRREGEDHPERPVVEAQVRRLEFNGPEILATLALGPHRLVARFPSEIPVRERETLRIAIDLRRASWFEPETGRALGRG